MEEKMKKTKVVGDGVQFERIRRITGYLVGTLDRFNNAKKAEVSDRVTHATKWRWNKISSWYTKW